MMKAMRLLVIALLAALIGCWGMGAFAETYYTLPEIREQAAAGWHKTYTDKYGRSRRVDIDIDVFGEETAPVFTACWGQPTDIKISGTSPRDAIKAARTKGNGVSTYPYKYVSGMKVDVDYKYAEPYGSSLTLREVYAYIQERLQELGVNQKYIWEQPETFSVLYSKHKKSGEILVPALYSIDLWPEEFGLPILTHVADSFKNDIEGPVPSWRLHFDVSDSCAFGGGFDLDVSKVLADDIPLCSVDKVIEGARKMIEDGYIREIFSLRFGYVMYSPVDAKWGTQQSSFEIDTWYLVPSWVMECYIADKIKADSLPDLPNMHRLVINAQTGKMTDYFDKSLYGRGDARYKGFISWEDVR